MGKAALVTNRFLVEGNIVLRDNPPDTGIWVYSPDINAYEGAAESINTLQGEPNGFLDQNDVTLTWEAPTRTLTIAPASVSYEVFINGTKFVKTSAESIQIDDVEGGVFIYFGSDGTLGKSSAFIADLIGAYALVAYVYWDATNKMAVADAFNELHGASMSPAVHRYLHVFEGTRYESGLGLAMEANGEGNDDAHAQFSAGSGVMWDEDVRHSVTAKGLTDTFQCVYKDGASGNWRAGPASTFPVLNTGSGRAAWNEWTGTTWQLTEVDNNDFVLAHVFAIPGLTKSWAVVVGQSEYNSRRLARDGAEEEISTLNLAGFPWVEAILVGTIIFQTSDGDSNTPKATIVTTDDGEDYVDWRTVTPLTGTAASAHNTLPNLQGGTTEERFHLSADLAAALENISDTDPGVVGQIWNDAGTFRASAG